MSQRTRDQMLNWFINGDAQLIFMGMKAGGIGLDGLQQAASNVLFLELAWSPADHAQAEDRIHRIGQQDGVTVWYVLGIDTIDELVFKMLKSGV